MPGFDIKTAIPITEEGGVATKPPEFDINTALKITEPVDSESGYEAFQRAQLHQQIKDGINRPLSDHETQFILDAEQKDPGVLNSLMVPYTEGVVGFLTKPFGYRPDLTKPFGLTKEPKSMAERKEEATMAKEHPVVFTLGQIVSGTAPFIALAPLFPASLLGTLATFETVGLTQKIGQIQTDESLMMPAGEKAKELGIEAIKSGVMAPIWYYSGALSFIGKPWLSAMARAGVRGTAVAGLEAVFGTDLEQALKQGGMITALSLIFEAPALAATALGRGYLKAGNQRLMDQGKPPVFVDINHFDQESVRMGVFRMVKEFYNMMRTKIENPAGLPIDPVKQITYDKLTYTPETPPVSPPEAQGGTIWVPKGVGTPPGGQPKAGGMMHLPEKAPVFYSKMAGALAEKMPESAPIDQVRGILQSSGIPKEEIEWSGVEDFLKGKDKISKTELLDYLQKNQMTIEETIKGGTSFTQRVKEIEQAFVDRGLTIQKEPGGEIIVENELGGEVHPDDLAKRDKELSNLANEYEKLKTDFDKEIPGGMPKYADPKYNVVTENYKEMLLRLPIKTSEDFGIDIKKPGSAAEYQEALRKAGMVEYQEPHWDIKDTNTFAHARIADVTDAQGHKGLFVNEIQSQWALEGRKEGFLKDPRSREKWKAIQEAKQKVYEQHPLRPVPREALDKLQELDDEMTKIIDESKKVPYHPVVSRWHEVILKRLLRYAAENGYEFVTWATGEQVADYYNLAKSVDEIKYIRHGTDDTEVELIKDGKILESRDVNDKQLTDFVGKDIAQKIIEGKKKGSIKGENLKIGGDWAKNLYDRQIPNWLNDYAKKFGAQVEMVDLGIQPKLDRDLFIQETGEGKFGVFTKEELEKLGMPEKEFDTEKEAQAYIDSFYQTVTQQSLAITPQMKQALLGEGQPMFGKMPKDVGKPGLEAGQMKIFRMKEEMSVVNTKGEIVTLPKGEEYRVLPVLDSEGNVVPNKVKLTDGKQVTVFEGELNKLKGHLLPAGEGPFAGGMFHRGHEGNLDKFVKKIEDLGTEKPARTEIFAKYDNALKPIGEIDTRYADNLGVKDNKVYSSEAYFIDHHVHNHPETTVEEYKTLPEVLLNPDDVKINNKKGERGYIFIKKYDKYHAAIANVEVEEGKIILHKTFFAQTKEPYKNLKSVGFKVAGEAAHPPSTKSQIETPAVDEISALPANENIPSEIGNVKLRVSQRKANMEFWNNPDITDKLLFSQKEFLKKYIDEKKSLKQIAEELGEDIEDVKKTEMETHARMEEMADEMRAEIEKAGGEEYLERKGELKSYLSEKFSPALKNEGEYSALKRLPWLWAKEGEVGIRPDTMAGEISGMGFPVESEADVIGLIETYFDKEIKSRAESFEVRYTKARQAELKRAATVKKAKPAKPERQISGVGNGSVISTKEDIDYQERAKIFKGMPFALLGNKAEVLSRLPGKFKAAIKAGVKKVFDLWGGAKGYRAGLFSNLPAADYNLNELSDERSNYYKNIQDPVKHVVMKKTLENIMTEFTALMNDAFELPEAKSDKDFLDMLNSWLKMGLKKERYYFAKEVIQDFGDRLLQEAQTDKFASPESSAKYFFLENTSIFGIGPEGWTQGIIRTTKGDAYIRDVLDKLIGISEKLDAEAKRDQGMPVTQEDAWTAMDKLTVDIRTGTVNPEETVVVVDPQYLNPTEKSGTYSVGASDTSWEGHKQNLEEHFLPLIKTGVKVIYTNNADQNLIDWMRSHKLPYNINQSIGAVAERRGRNEIISFIGFSFGPEWTVGQLQPAGAGVLESGQQYVAPRVTGQSAKFTEWLKKQEEIKQQEAQKQELIVKIDQIAKGKQLSNITVSRIRKYLGIKEMKNTGIAEIQKLVDYLEGMQAGDKLLSEKQIEVLKGMLGDIKDLTIMPKRIVIEQFGEDPNLMEGRIVRHISLELMPTVDIKQGHPAIAKIIGDANEKLEYAESEIHRRDDQLEEMLTKAEKSRAAKLKTGEKIKRSLVKQNKEIFRALSGAPVDLTKEEVAVVAYLKNFFVMVKEKLALEKYRQNYVTHLEQPLSEKILEVGVIGAIRQYFREQAGKKEIPTDIMLELDNIIGSEKFFRFALERKGGIEPTTNIRKIVHDYSSLFETKTALDQILPEGQAITKLILQGKSAVWLKKFLQNMKGRAMDNEFRTGRMGWLTRVADGIIDWSYIKLLSLNWRSALKNIVAGEANAMIWQDFPVYLKGKQRFLSHFKKAYKLAIEHGVLEGTYADYTQRGIGRLKSVQDKLMMGQQLGEIEIRTCMFVSELTDQEWESGEISPERSRKLRDNIAITQGVFSKTESPLWVQTSLGRMIMQMNRWRITDAMLLRRIVNGAKEEWSRGDYKGQNSQRLSKAIFFYAIGMYVSYELAKAGYKKAAQIAQAMAEAINGLISLISQGDLMKMLTDNPTLSVVKELFFTLQSIASYIHVPGAQRPSKIKIQQGIEDTYIAPLNTVKDIVNELEQ